MQIALNGVLCPADKAVVSVYDHGFLYGVGLFETFRTYGGAPFLLEEHLFRLQEGCRELSIAYQADEGRIRGLVRELLHANGLSDAYVRLSVSGGVDALGLPSDEYGSPAEILYMKALPEKAPREPGLSGKALQLLNTRRNTPEGDMRLKSFHYLNCILGKRELARYPWAQGAEGLFLDDCGFVAEGIVSNVFFVQEGMLQTPALETGILQGVTRSWVLDAASSCGITAEEGFYPWEALVEADEVFITNSIQEIVPVTRLFDPEGTQCIIGDGSAGPITQKLAELYKRAAQGGEDA